MNVVIYARYSSTSQRDASIEVQLDACHEFCKKNDMIVVEEYVDKALTGKTSKRPNFLRMIEDSKKRYFERVIVFKFDRFSRNRRDHINYKDQLKQNGVRVLSVCEQFGEGPQSELAEGIFECMTEFYSAELAQKIKDGMDFNAQNFLSTGSVALGYKVGPDKKLQINEATAPLVRYIYKEYANGKTIKEITEYLNSKGYKTSTGAEFNKNSLRTILQNKRYIGYYTYKGVETPNVLPRIISDDLFYKVADIMEKNKRAPARSRAKVEYLLTTKLFCGHCKEMMIGFSGTGKLGVTYRYYTCKGRNRKVCNKEMVKKDYIENLVLSECRKVLTEANISKISKEVFAIIKAQHFDSTLNILKKQLKENERRQNNMLESVMDCDDRNLRQTFYAQISKLQEEHKQIEKEIALEEKKMPTTLTESHIRFFLYQLKKGDFNDIKYKKMLIKVFVNAIYLYDDKITLIFNAGDKPVTISDKHLSDIEESYANVEGLFLDKSGPLKSREHFAALCFFILSNILLHFRN